MNKKIYLLLFFVLVLISISAVSAADADGNNDTIVSSGDAGALAVANDVDTIDDLDENNSDDGDKAIENDAKSVVVGKNKGNDLLSADNNENGNILTAAPKTYYVNASAASGGTGTETAPFQTLNAALNKAENGDTIMIAAGEYKGTDNTGLQIWRNLNFIKYGESEAIFDAEGQGRIWTVMDDSINIIGLTFKNGKSTSNGGAIYMRGGNVINCTFIDNTASTESTSYGGAIYCLYYTNVTNCNFTGNYARYMGGAFYTMRGGNVSNCIFIGNTANWWGGAIRLETVDNTKGTVTNCAFFNNTAQNGKVISSSSVLESIDNNWWGSNNPNWNELINKAGIPSSYAILNGSADSETIKPGSKAKLTYGFYSNATGDLLSIPSRPIELSATGGHLDDDTGYLVNGEFSTEFSSDALGEFEITATVDNQEVKLTETVAATVWYVNATAAPGGDGKSQATPFQTLKEALDVAEDYDIIMIAAGTYTGKNNTGLTINHKLTFEKYGEGEAILDAENQWRIWYVNAGTININGLTFKNGKTEWDNGGAIYCNEPLSNSNINATFINNSAENYGGAIFFVGLTNVNITGIFTDNKVDYEDGGAIYFNWNNVEHVIISGEFKNNHAQNGGAIYFDGQLTDVNITGNFTDNIVDGGGGAIYCNEALSNSNIMASFINNTANSFGGAISFSNPTQLTNVNIYGEFINNTATVDSGGAIMFWNMVSDSIIDASFINNKAGDRGAAICFSSTLKNTDITGKFINNTGNSVIHIHAAGPYMSPSGYVYDVIHDSIFINNDASKIINIDSGEVLANDNWFGNNATNYDEAPDVGIDLKDWLFLNATADSTEIGIGENSKITFKLSSYNRNEVSNYNGPIDIKLDLNQTLGELDKTAASLGEEITYTAKNEGDASVTATFETASYTVDLINIKPKTPTSINLTNETMNLKVGDETPAGATLDPANAGNLTYKSSDESVVTVENGIIKAVGDGTANVTVSFNGTDVYAPAERNISVSVSLNEAVWYYILQDVRRELDGASLLLPFGVYNCLVVNSTGQPLPKGLNVTIKLDDAYTINSTVGDDGIFEVDVNGITPKFYTATFSSYGYTSAVATVLIVKKHTSIALENETMALKVNDNVSSGATLNPAEAGNLTYTSSNSTVAIVENGEIKALAKGTTNITVTFAGDDEYAAAQYKIIEVTVALNDASVTVNNDTLDLLVGDEFTLVAEPVPAGLDVNFTSTDSSVVTVDADGKVTAVGNGTATIVVSVGDDKVYAINTTSVAVTVKIPTEINITNSSVEMYIGEEGEISWAKLIPPEAGSLKYSSNNASVIWVSTSGEFTANGAGTAIITVSFEGNDDYAAAENKTIYVTVKLKDASVVAYDMELIVGSNETIYYFTDPDGLNVTFVQDDSGVYTVDSNGVVTALKEGTGNILVKVGGDGVYAENSTEILVTVSKIPTEISVAAGSLDLKVLENFTAGATLTPADAGNLTYTSSNKTVVIVEDGMIMAIGEGTATVTVSFAGDDKYAAAENKTIDVAVSLNPASVSVNNSTLELYVDDNFTIVATTTPAGLNVTYVPDNSGVYTVDENGVVTALREGTGVIIVKIVGEGVYVENSTAVAVSVSKIPTEITIANATLDVKALNFTFAGATLNPAEAGNLSYNSSNSSVAMVFSGIIFSVGQGNAVITVSYDGNDKYEAAENKTISITVSLNDVSVSVNNSTLDLKVGDTFAINATTVPAIAKMFNVTYNSSDESVVTVDKNGTVTAIGEGNAIITVGVGDGRVFAKNSTEILVTVTKIPTEISVAAGSLDLKVLENFTAGATLTPADAGNLTYTSSNKTVVIVEDGMIMALGEGTATVTVSFAGDDKYAAAENKTIDVAVSLNPASVSVNNSTLELYVDDNFTIVATPVPSGLNVTFVQDDSGVYTVDSNGVVTALKEGTGNVLVKVGDGKVYAENSTEIAVTVSKIPTDISVAAGALDLKVLENFTAGASLTPADAGNMTYTSSNKTVVIVEDGMIMAIGEGTATVTVSFAGDDKYAAAENKTIDVAVSLNPASVSVNNSTLELYVDDNFTIVATTTPAGLNVTFVQDDSGVYTVDENGLVTALKEGTGNILVKVGDGKVYAENSTEIHVTVSKIPTEIIVQNATIEMKVTDEVSPVVSIMPSDAGELDFTSSDVSVVTVNGIGTITAVGEGVANVTVRFIGNDKYSAAESKNITVTVSKIATEIVALPVTTVYNVGEKLVITLKDENGNPLNNTEITVNLNGVGTFITDENGQVNISTRPLLPDFYMAEITFKGNDVYDKSAKSVKVKIQKAATKITMKSRTYKATTKVKKYTIAIKNNKGIPLYNKKVYIIIRGVTYSAITDSQGFATFKITNLNKKGTFKATAYYKGNNINKRTTNQAQLVVK